MWLTLAESAGDPRHPSLGCGGRSLACLIEKATLLPLSGPVQRTPCPGKRRRGCQLWGLSAPLPEAERLAES